MNDQISSVLKELKAEQSKIAALIEKVQEARFTQIKKELAEIAKSSPNTAERSHESNGYSTKAEVARHLNVSVRTVDYWKSHNIIPYFKIGGMVRFRLGDIDRALQEKYRIHSAYEHRW